MMDASSQGKVLKQLNVSIWSDDQCANIKEFRDGTIKTPAAIATHYGIYGA